MPRKRQNPKLRKHVRAVSNALTLSAVVASPYFGTAAIAVVAAGVILLAIIAEESQQ
jgi:hypothetical protein